MKFQRAHFIQYKAASLLEKLANADNTGMNEMQHFGNAILFFYILRKREEIRNGKIYLITI